jgi:hypothetical protein
VYLNFETDNVNVIEYLSYDDFRFDQIESEEIYSLFESTCYDCSDNSDRYIGLTINDFIFTPRITYYIFIFLILIGIIFAIYVLIDRKKDFTEETKTIANSIFIIFIILSGTILLIINIKFIGAYLLQQINKPFIQALGFNRLQMIFFMPYISILFSFIFLIIGFTYLKINLNKAVSSLGDVKTKNTDVDYKRWSRI